MERKHTKGKQKLPMEAVAPKPWYTDLKMHLIILIGLGVMVFLLNKRYLVTGFFMDDLSIWTQYHDMSSWEFIFSQGAQKIRPVSYLFLYIVFSIVGNQVELVGYWILFFYFLAVGVVYLCCYWLSKNKMISTTGALLYLFSFMAYYQVGQFFGIMESVGTIFALIYLFLALKLVSGKNDRLYFWLSLLGIVLAVYSHERYLGLLGVQFVVLLIRAVAHKQSYKRELIYALYTVALLVVIIGNRFLLFGNRAFDGTGGTDMASTFSFFSFLKHLTWSVLNMFGIGVGETYLTGIAYHILPLNILTFLSILVVAGFAAPLITGVYIVIKNKKFEILMQLLVIATFIGMCLVASCATIRLEMRWIYTSFAAMTILWSYLLSVCTDFIEIKKTVAVTTACIFVGITAIPLQLYYRSTNFTTYFSIYQSTLSGVGKIIAEHNNLSYETPIVLLEPRGIYTNNETFLDWMNKFLNLRVSGTNNPPAEFYLYASPTDVPKEILSRDPIVLYATFDAIGKPMPMLDLTEVVLQHKIIN